MNWDSIIEQVAPCVVKIETPDGHGTGFLCYARDDGQVCAIATAAHVVDHADTWQQPIRIVNHSLDQSTLLKEDERVILKDAHKDSAVILMDAAKLKLPERVIPLLPTETRLPIGVEVGWIGYPGIGPQNTLCFFSGSVSARLEGNNSYLIDGVAINGVSGGPVLYCPESSDAHIVGAISAYMPNRATGDTLPGLCVARDVSHFHDSITTWKFIEEAERAKADIAASPEPPKETSDT